jgi:CRISPR-associated protein Csd1
MLLQALVHYADTDLASQLADQAFEFKPVPYAMEIDQNGKFLGIRQRMREVIRGTGKKQKAIQEPEKLLVPKSPENRNSGIKPLLGCDAIQYVSGPMPGAWTTAKDISKHRDQHNGFVQFITKAALETTDVALKACTLFYSDDMAVAQAQKELSEKKPAMGSLVTLSVRFSNNDTEGIGGPIVERKKIREYWRTYYEEKFAERHAEGGNAICLISGKYGPVAVTHEKIKGMGSLGGQAAGVSLMSFDKEAFCSYGWKKNTNSPVNPERAMAYVLALNDLLIPGPHRHGMSRDKVVRTRTDLAGVGFLYWTSSPSDDDIMSLVEGSNPDDINKLLVSLHTGNNTISDQIDQNNFYLLVVSGNGGRLVIRDWHTESLLKVKMNIKRWFDDQKVPNVFSKGEWSDPPRLKNLIREISPPRMEFDDNANADKVMRMIQRALFGLPLSRTILSSALNRLRVEKGSNRLSPVRIGLIRLCVNDILVHEKKGVPMSSSLDPNDPNQKHPAFICGRLLAVYDGLQYQSQGDVGVTVADRFYGLASTYPLLAFPKLETLSKAYLKKLRRDNGGAAYAISKRIDDLTVTLISNGGKYPGQLNLEDQGRFAIGFHFQKAEDARAREEAQNRKNQP